MYVVEIKLSPGRLFNMDKTGLSQKSTFEKLCCGHRFKNLWSKSVDDNFHLTITACVADNGFVVTPMLIVFGQRLN